MSEIKYVVRFFSSDDQYLYSIHCGSDILDDLLEKAKSDNQKFKVLAYKNEDEN